MTIPTVWRRRRILLLASALAAVSGTARAAYPDRPIRVISGYPPGGTYDIAARIVARRLEALLGQPVVVENRPGASGAIADRLVARAAPDGYTLLVGGSTLVSLAATRADYTAHKELVPIMRLGTSPIVLTALKSAPFATLPELIAYAKTHPRKLNCAIPGLNTGPHLAAELLKFSAGIDFVIVPYPGVAASQQALLAGDVDLIAMPPFNNDRVRDIVVLGTTRSDVVPSVPTAVELGLKDYFASSWLALLAPPGTPREIRDQLAGVVARMLQEPETRAALLRPPVVVTPMPNESPEQFARQMAEQIDAWRSFITRSGLKLE